MLEILFIGSISPAVIIICIIVLILFALYRRGKRIIDEENFDNAVEVQLKNEREKN